MITGVAFIGVGKDSNTELHTSVGFSRTSASIRGNFGRGNFVYDLNERISSNERAKALAASMPSEILTVILHFLDKPHSQYPAVKHDHNRPLGNCALTCRYWASRCRKIMFETVYIHSRNRYEAFLRLLTSEGYQPEPIANIVRRLAIQDPFAERAWGFTFSSLVPALPLLEELSYYGPSQAYNTQPPMLANMLPTLFASFRDISTLSLMRHHFKSFISLARFLFVFQTMKTLVVDTISWDKQPAEPPAMKLTRQITTIRIRNCSKCLTLLWLLVAPLKATHTSTRSMDTHSRPVTRPVLSMVDATLMWKLARVVARIDREDHLTGLSNCDMQYSKIDTVTDTHCNPDFIFVAQISLITLCRDLGNYLRDHERHHSKPQDRNTQRLSIV